MSSHPLNKSWLTGERSHELMRHRLTQEHVDYLVKRRMKEWWKSLQMLRMYGTVRTDL